MNKHIVYKYTFPVTYQSSITFLSAKRYIVIMSTMKSEGPDKFPENAPSILALLSILMHLQLLQK